MKFLYFIISYLIPLFNTDTFNKGKSDEIIKKFEKLENGGMGSNSMPQAPVVWSWLVHTMKYYDY